MARPNCANFVDAGLMLKVDLGRESIGEWRCSVKNKTHLQRHILSADVVFTRCVYPPLDTLHSTGRTSVMPRSCAEVVLKKLFRGELNVVPDRPPRVGAEGDRHC